MLDYLEKFRADNSLNLNISTRPPSSIQALLEWLDEVMLHLPDELSPGA